MYFFNVIQKKGTDASVYLILRVCAFCIEIETDRDATSLQATFSVTKVVIRSKNIYFLPNKNIILLIDKQRKFILDSQL